MNKIKFENLGEAICLALILSYFLIHNIIIVVIGIILSIYLINTRNMKQLFASIHYKLNDKGINNDLQNNKDSVVSITNHIDLYKNNSELSLVEIIENEGFIPSLKKKDDSNAA